MLGRVEGLGIRVEEVGVCKAGGYGGIFDAAKLGNGVESGGGVMADTDEFRCAEVRYDGGGGGDLPGQVVEGLGGGHGCSRV